MQQTLNNNIAKAGRALGNNICRRAAAEGRDIGPLALLAYIIGRGMTMSGAAY